MSSTWQPHLHLPATLLVPLRGNAINQGRDFSNVAFVDFLDLFEGTLGVTRGFLMSLASQFSELLPAWETASQHSPQGERLLCPPVLLSLGVLFHNPNTYHT